MPTGRHQHRTSDVASGSKYGVGTNGLDDARARHGSDGCATKRLDQLETRAARKTLYDERHKRVAASWHEFGLDTRRCARKGDIGTTLTQGVGDGQRWCNVTNGSASGNQDPHWHASKARGRCGA